MVHIKSFSEFTFSNIILDMIQDLFKTNGERLSEFTFDKRSGIDIVIKKQNKIVCAICIAFSENEQLIKDYEKSLIEFESKMKFKRILISWPNQSLDLQDSGSDKITYIGNQFIFELTSSSKVEIGKVEKLRDFIIYSDLENKRRIAYECISQTKSQSVPSALKDLNVK